MLNSRKLPSQDLSIQPQTLKHERDHNLWPQILCNEESAIRDSIPVLENWGAKAIDINMGCPVRKALKHNYGVSLMGDIDYASEVVLLASKYATVPISVKLRAGLQKDETFLLRFCEALIKNGANWLTLHPRTAEEKRKGEADWKQIKLLKDNFDIPIIGNGDIQCFHDIESLFERTQCDAVMIGRAFTAKPWLFLEYARSKGIKLSSWQESQLPDSPEAQAKAYGEFLKIFVSNCFKHFSDKDAIKRILFMVRVGHVWLNFGHSLSKKLQKISDLQSTLEIIETFFMNQDLTMYDRTNLRY